ncbi:hypothetical protein [Tsukamurella sp. 1534]|uniref:hypothetical protein n=1 Tax=Tsukamurella sp. 1534 TaxID=1151061 RepID=UPI00030081D6|nr:hypothetical protein [Tsukamurella sp. 1534]
MQAGAPVPEPESAEIDPEALSQLADAVADLADEAGAIVDDVLAAIHAVAFPDPDHPTAGDDTEGINPAAKRVSAVDVKAKALELTTQLT